MSPYHPRWAMDTGDRNASMVRTLLASRAIRTPELADAFLAVPRHLFLTGVELDRVYSAEEAIATRFGAGGLPVSSSSAPLIMAVMAEQLAVGPGSRVLEVGAGTGYNAAILATFTGEAGDVTTIDIDPEITRQARSALDAAGLERVRVITGDGWSGCPEHAPYDAIEVTAAVWDISPAWVNQLGEGGRLVAPVVLVGGIQVSAAFRREQRALVGINMERCGFMQLRGPHGGPGEHVALAGWTAALESPTPRAIRVLGALLRSKPERIPAPALPEGWFVRLAIGSADAIRLWETTNWRHQVGGLFDEDMASLAVVDGRTILSYGDPSCADRLRAALRSARGLRLEGGRIDALPAGESDGSGGELVLRRPSFDLLLRDVD